MISLPDIRSHLERYTRCHYRCSPINIRRVRTAFLERRTVNKMRAVPRERLTTI